MFDWFKKPNYSNVVKFPDTKTVPQMPYVEPPPAPEKPAHTYYRLGLTDNNRVSLTMGYSEVTFSAAGVDNLIAQLEVFRNQLSSEENEE